jgi:hypothetical protein
VLQALEFRICDGWLGISPRNTASHEGGRAVVHMEVPMSPAPRQSVPLPTMETDTTQIVGRTGNAARAGPECDQFLYLELRLQPRILPMAAALLFRLSDGGYLSVQRQA